MRCISRLGSILELDRQAEMNEEEIDRGIKIFLENLQLQPAAIPQSLNVDENEVAVTSSVETDNNITLNAIERRYRKRKSDNNAWKKNVTKSKRNKGEEYTNYKGQLVGKRELKPPCSNKYIYKCSELFASADREHLFNLFWNFGDINIQRNYIANNLSPLKSRNEKGIGCRTPMSRNRNQAFSFQLKDCKIRVCKLFFINTLGISDRTVRTVVEKTQNGCKQTDERGKHKNHRNVDTTIVSDIVSHIDSIPRIESHYLREQTTRQYIEGGKI